MLSLLVSLVIKTQQLHFAFFEEQVTLINPAFCGIAAPMKFTSSYRTQWRHLNDNYRSYGFIGEARFKAQQWKQIDSHRGLTFKHNSYGHFAVGLALFNDGAGAGQLNNFTTQLSVSTFLQTGSKSIFSLGVAALYKQRSIQGAKLLFPDQYTTIGYSSQMPSQEPWKTSQVNFFNGGVGLAWHYNQHQFDDYSRKCFGSIGFALNSLLPEPTFASNQVNTSKSLHVTAWFHFPTGKLCTVPLLQLIKNGPSSELVFGSMFRSYFNEISKYTGLNKQSWLGLGGFIRMNDAVILRLQYQHRDQYAIGFGYEVTLSPLQQHTGTGGSLELFLRYQPPKAFLYQNKVQE